ncbi:hypothetical protein HK102_008687 [Quaeritorhiza haematococci]|nr:hypothetical protein HK102_008687 [Quaeritorhiza haematococci]
MCWPGNVVKSLDASSAAPVGCQQQTRPQTQQQQQQNQQPRLQFQNAFLGGVLRNEFLSSDFFNFDETCTESLVSPKSDLLETDLSYVDSSSVTAPLPDSWFEEMLKTGLSGSPASPAISASSTDDVPTPGSSHSLTSFLSLSSNESHSPLSSAPLYFEGTNSPTSGGAGSIVATQYQQQQQQQIQQQRVPSIPQQERPQPVVLQRQVSPPQPIQQQTPSPAQPQAQRTPSPPQPGVNFMNTMMASGSIIPTYNPVFPPLSNVVPASTYSTMPNTTQAQQPVVQISRAKPIPQPMVAPPPRTSPQSAVPPVAPAAQCTSVKRKRECSSSDDSGSSSSGAPLDRAAIKRQKNTEAARRSRQRKMQKMEELEHQVADLTNENTDLCTRLAVLDAEKLAWQAKEVEFNHRIERLEAQLAESHKAMLLATNGALPAGGQL